jgi:integrase
VSWTEGGVRHRKAQTFDLRNDAEWWLSQFHRHGEAPEDLRVADYMERWLAGKRHLSDETKVLYRNHVHVHIIPVLGGFKLVDLRARHVEAFVDDRCAYVSPRGNRKLAPKTIGAILITLRSALAEAVPRTIPDNPAAGVKGPRVERRMVKAMTGEDVTALLAAVEGTWTEHIVRFLLGSGLRIGEAVALNQGDVHDRWVGLRKSKTTIRAVRMSQDGDSAIHEAIRQAPRRGRGEPVFFGPKSGDRLAGDSLTHALPRILERAGVGRASPHALRHATATLMVAKGVHMRVVAEQLGHADPAMTSRVYAHVAPDTQAAALDVLDEAVKR